MKNQNEDKIENMELMRKAAKSINEQINEMSFKIYHCKACDKTTHSDINGNCYHCGRGR